MKPQARRLYKATPTSLLFFPAPADQPSALLHKKENTMTTAIVTTSTTASLPPLSPSPFESPRIPPQEPFDLSLSSRPSSLLANDELSLPLMRRSMMIRCNFSTASDHHRTSGQLRLCATCDNLREGGGCDLWDKKPSLPSSSSSSSSHCSCSIDQRLGSHITSLVPSCVQERTVKQLSSYEQ